MLTEVIHKLHFRNDINERSEMQEEDKSAFLKIKFFLGSPYSFFFVFSKILKSGLIVLLHISIQLIFNHFVRRVNNYCKISTEQNYTQNLLF